MNEELVKSLTDLIEETISEIEDLKKSRFSASEVKIAGPGEDGIKGHSADGKLDKEEDKDSDDDDKDDKKKDMDKGENEKADPGPVHHVAKADDDKDDKKKDDEDDDKDDKKMDKGENEKADPGPVHHVAKAEPKEGYDIKKSLDAQESLMKSYIDNKVAPLETKLNSLLDLVGKIAEQPVPAKGASAKNFAILSKNADGSEVAPLSKSQVANKLFELKKSGASVDSADITAAELGTTNVQELISKYNLK